LYRLLGVLGLLGGAFGGSGETIGQRCRRFDVRLPRLRLEPTDVDGHRIAQMRIETDSVN